MLAKISDFFQLKRSSKQQFQSVHICDALPVSIAVHFHSKSDRFCLILSIWRSALRNRHTLKIAFLLYNSLSLQVSQNALGKGSSCIREKKLPRLLLIALFSQLESNREVRLCQNRLVQRNSQSLSRKLPIPSPDPDLIILMLVYQKAIRSRTWAPNLSPWLCPAFLRSSPFH